MTYFLPKWNNEIHSSIYYFDLRYRRLPALPGGRYGRGGGLHIFAQQVIVSDHLLFVIPFFLSMHLLTFSFQLFYQNNWVYKPNFAQNILWRSSVPSFLNKFPFNLLEIRLDRVTLRYTVLKVPSILLPLYIYYCSVNEQVRFLKLFHYMTN